MYYNLIKSFVNKLTNEDIENYALKEGIELTKDEVEIIKYYIINHWETFYYGNPRSILEELKTKVRDIVYKKIEILYLQYKEKLV